MQAYMMMKPIPEWMSECGKLINKCEGTVYTIVTNELRASSKSTYACMLHAQH